MNLVIGFFLDIRDEFHAVIRIKNNSNQYLRVEYTGDRAQAIFARLVDKSYRVTPFHFYNMDLTFTSSDCDPLRETADQAMVCGVNLTFASGDIEDVRRFIS